MPDETLYRCLSASCARSLPRRVNFCPYCGTAQHAGTDGDLQPGAGAAALPAPELRKGGAGVPPPAPPAAPGTAAALAPEWGAAPLAGAAAPAAARAGTAGAAAAAPPQPAALPRAPVPAPAAAPARPPEREPVRLRWWLLALAVLWLVWIKEKPSTNRIDARIDRAVALATDCKAREAQSELIALRSTGATEDQLLRVQQALNEAAAACSRSRQRGRAWRGAQAEAPVATASAGLAGTALAGFIRRRHG